MTQHIFGVKRNFPNYNQAWFCICKREKKAVFQPPSISSVWRIPLFIWPFLGPYSYVAYAYPAPPPIPGGLQPSHL